MSAILAFTKVRGPGGWMSNMSPHPVEWRGVRGRTSEHIFQALRLDPELRSGPARAVLEETSPMAAKFTAKRLFKEGHAVVELWSPEDVDNMRLCVMLKAQQHPDLGRELSGTEGVTLIEDTSNRGRPDIFWGARLGKVGEVHPEARYQSSEDQWWIGKNWLGEIWMAQRSSGRLV